MSATEHFKDLKQAVGIGLDWMARAKDAEAKLAALTTLRPASEWKEADGAVLWWRIDVGRDPSPCYAHAGVPNVLELTHWSPIPNGESPR